jgi:hypothetical protein
MEEYRRQIDARNRARAEAPAAAPEASASASGGGEVMAAYRPLGDGEQRLEGTLERITCPPKPPATFHVRTAGGLQTLEAASLTEVDFITYRNDLTGSVSCGPLKAPLPVYVTWRAGAKPGARRVVAVEFLPPR